MRCVRCHVDDSLKDKTHLMPELATDAPSLVGIGSRLNSQWMAAWIANPKSLRPTATMPHLLGHLGDKAGDAAADIAAYLATLKANAALSQRFVAAGDLWWEAARGRGRYGWCLMS